MNPIGKKLLSLFLVFSLMMLSVNLYAKEKRGAKLLITKKDGWQREGELITVKPSSLLILNPEGKDVSVDIADIKVIKVMKKSKTSWGAGLGVLVGVGAGASIGYKVGWETSEGALWGGVMGVLAGGLLGGFIGKSLGKDVTIQIEGMTDFEIQETLDKLRKKARIRDYK